MAKAPKSNGKVGTDPQALHRFGGKGDFGIPARDKVARAHEGQIEGRPAGTSPGYSGDVGARTTGVGSRGGPPGKDSGGDIDTDIIGLDGRGGFAARPASGKTTLANDTDGSSDVFASGGHAKGEHAIRRGSHGASPKSAGDYVDHSGSDSSAVNPNAAGSVNPARGEDPGAEGEITGDEATGDLDEGAEV